MRKRGYSTETKKDFVFQIINSLGMILVAVITIYPFWYCIVLSLSNGIDAMKAPLYLWPRMFTLENYQFILTNPRMLTAITNSVLRTILGTLLHVGFTGLVAYGLSKRWLVWRRFYMVLFIIPMYFSGGLIPTYLLLRNINLLDTFLLYIIPTAWSFFNAILFMAYYETIPVEMEEAATIDGAGHFRIFARIILPASLPILATVALFSGVNQWNSWFDTMVFTTKDSLVTLQSIMAKMIRDAEALQEINKQLSLTTGGSQAAVAMYSSIRPITVRVATMVFTTFPITVAYPFLQKYFVKGIMIGSVKG